MFLSFLSFLLPTKLRYIAFVSGQFLLQYKKDMISKEEDFLNLKILLIRSKILTK